MTKVYLDLSAADAVEYVEVEDEIAQDIINEIKSGYITKVINIDKPLDKVWFAVVNLFDVLNEVTYGTVGALGNNQESFAVAFKRRTDLQGPFYKKRKVIIKDGHAELTLSGPEKLLVPYDPKDDLSKIIVDALHNRIERTVEHNTLTTVSFFIPKKDILFNKAEAENFLRSNEIYATILSDAGCVVV